MAECAKLKGCPFFNDRMQGMDGMVVLYKKRFCTGDFSQCARWQVSQTGAVVPADLFPNQIERVAALVRPEAK